jgi:hypothetical protein
MQLNASKMKDSSFPIAHSGFNKKKRMVHSPESATSPSVPKDCPPEYWESRADREREREREKKRKAKWKNSRQLLGLAKREREREREGSGRADGSSRNTWTSRRNKGPRQGVGYCRSRVVRG